MFLCFLIDWFICFIVSLLRFYFDSCPFSCLFTLSVVFVLLSFKTCFVLPMWRIKIYIAPHLEFFYDQLALRNPDEINLAGSFNTCGAGL